MQKRPFEQGTASLELWPRWRRLQSLPSTPPHGVYEAVSRTSGFQLSYVRGLRLRASWLQVGFAEFGIFPHFFSAYMGLGFGFAVQRVVGLGVVGLCLTARRYLLLHGPMARRLSIGCDFGQRDRLDYPPTSTATGRLPNHGFRSSLFETQTATGASAPEPEIKFSS